jgi:two-component system chemotaxis sensor kinase CheA
MFSGTTILGDGSVIMIIDPNALAAASGSLEKHSAESAEAEPVADKDKAQDVMPMLLFRAGTDALKAIPLALITRLEEIRLDEIERCNGDDVVHYRGALMPLVDVGGNAGRVHEGVRPVLVFTEGGRPAGLAIDEIVDIVETPLSIEIRADEPGLIGAAIINGNAVEIVDVSHYLGDRLGGRLFSQPSAARGMSRLLLVDDSQFFRNMLAPLLMAAGYDVTLAGSADEALAMKDRGQSFDLIISDLDMPGMDGIAFAGHVKSDPAWSGTPLVALSSYANPSVIERSRAAGFVSYVGKFDRQRLMDTLQSFSKEWGSAA